MHQNTPITLSDDTLFVIFQFLDLPTLIRCEKAGTKWKQILVPNWKLLYIRMYFGEKYLERKCAPNINWKSELIDRATDIKVKYLLNKVQRFSASDLIIHSQDLQDLTAATVVKQREDKIVSILQRKDPPVGIVWLKKISQSGKLFHLTDFRENTIDVDETVMIFEYRVYLTREIGKYIVFTGRGLTEHGYIYKDKTGVKIDNKFYPDYIAHAPLRDMYNLETNISKIWEILSSGFDEMDRLGLLQ
jgi:hypothetical protein